MASILPLFAEYPEEGMIVGRLVTGYGELELDLGTCLGGVLGDNTAAIRVMFRTRGEEQRILIADALMRQSYISKRLGGTYSEAIADMNYCRLIRNQYAHCHWFDQHNKLCFVEVEHSARKHGAMFVQPRPLTVDLLKKQEEYFSFVQDCLVYLRYKHSGETPPSHARAKPRKVARPLRHSG